MSIRLLCIGCLSVALVVPTVMAQSEETIELDDLKGVWSGTWVGEASQRNPVTVEFSMEGESLAGRMRTPAASDFNEVSFDPATSTIRAEAADAEGSTRYAIEGQVEGTRITGTFSQNDTNGRLALVKWTFIP